MKRRSALKVLAGSLSAPVVLHATTAKAHTTSDPKTMTNFARPWKVLHKLTLDSQRLASPSMTPTAPIGSTIWVPSRYSWGARLKHIFWDSICWT